MALPNFKQPPSVPPLLSEWEIRFACRKWITRTHARAPRKLQSSSLAGRILRSVCWFLIALSLHLFRMPRQLKVATTTATLDAAGNCKQKLKRTRQGRRQDMSHNYKTHYVSLPRWRVAARAFVPHLVAACYVRLLVAAQRERERAIKRGELREQNFLLNCLGGAAAGKLFAQLGAWRDSANALPDSTSASTSTATPTATPTETSKPKVKQSKCILLGVFIAL